MKKIFFSVIFTILAVSLYAQRGEGMARIHAAKIAYIADRINLSNEQLGAFRPLYNDYQKDVRETRRSFFSKYHGTRPDEADDATSLQWIDDNLDYQQQIIQLKRNYNERFLKIISPRQLSDLYKAEREFNQILLQRLKQERGGRFNHKRRD